MESSSSCLIGTSYSSLRAVNAKIFCRLHFLPAPTTRSSLYYWLLKRRSPFSRPLKSLLLAGGSVSELYYEELEKFMSRGVSWEENCSWKPPLYAPVGLHRTADVFAVLAFGSAVAAVLHALHWISARRRHTLFPPPTSHHAHQQLLFFPECCLN